MFIYNFILTIIALFSTLELMGINRKLSKVLFVFFSFFLYLLAFLRWKTGTDWFGYVNIFKFSLTDEVAKDYEFLFLSINQFVRSFSNNYTVNLFVLATILFYFQIKSVLKLSLYPLLTLLCLWGVYFANVFFVRQTIAIVILFYSIRFIQENNFKKFAFYIIVATLFHKSSFVFIAAWWIYRLKISTKMKLILIGSSVILSALFSLLLNNLAEVADDSTSKRLDIYLQDEDRSEEELNTLNQTYSYTTILIKGLSNKMFIFFMALYVYNKNKFIDNTILRGYLNLYTFGVILFFSTVSISIVFSRLALPYDYLQILIIPIFLKTIKGKLKLLFFMLILIYLYLRLYTAVNSYIDSFIPMRTIFDFIDTRI